MEFDDLSNRVIGCAIEVHRHLGPGLLEWAYEQCLGHELSRHNIAFQLQLAQPVRYKDVLLDCGYRIDVLVENRGSKQRVPSDTTTITWPIDEFQLCLMTSNSGWWR